MAEDEDKKSTLQMQGGFIRSQSRAVTADSVTNDSP